MAHLRISPQGGAGYWGFLAMKVTKYFRFPDVYGGISIAAN